MKLADIKKAPQDFLYLYATDLFLSKLDQTTAAKIRDKRARQYKIVLNACKKEGANYADVVAELNEILKDNFSHSGADCLKILADGGEIAGKDWSKGIYGIGATTYEGFSGTDITVDPDTGKLLKAGEEITGQTAIYGKNSTTYTAVVDGTTYTSQANKDGMYSAGTYTNAEGKTFNPTGGAAGLGSFSDIWAAISSFQPMIDSIITWLRSLFPDMFAGTSTITAKNSVPSQKDGFTQSGSGDTITTVGIFAGIAAVVYALLKKKNK